MASIGQLVKNSTAYKKYKAAKLAKESQVWEKDDDQRLAFYSTMLNNNDVCFDIGANLGNRTKIFSRIVGPHGKVVAVEPQNFCMDVLRTAFGDKKNIVFVAKAVGTKEGEAEILISNESTVSSMSEEWIKTVSESKRFGDETSWNQKQKVEVTTIDALVEEFGAPAFIKIDVEGFEFEVVQGLTKPIETTLSLEFTPEYHESTYACLEYLDGIGSIECNYSKTESMVFQFDQWLTKDKMREALAKYQDDTTTFGDVYIRLSP